MNDPHVVALVYRIEDNSSVDYHEAPPLDHEEERFRLHVEDRQVRFELKEHCATSEAARTIVEPYIRNWELDAGLRTHRFKLRFERPEIVDRNPTPGKVSAGAAYFNITIPTAQVTVTAVVPSYPRPPSGLTLDPDNPDVMTMYDRYTGYLEGRELLTSMAYFCLTMFTEYLNVDRRAAASKYRIEKKVLRKIGDLSTNRGGPAGARKAKGVGQDLTAAESHFLDEAVKAIIRRVAEVAHDPGSDFPRIRLSDLPNLSP